ncbi:MAG: hypothetical protein ACOX9C_08320 [Kiritimatiellia bacterium]|jgi:hypothetical protein
MFNPRLDNDVFTCAERPLFEGVGAAITAEADALGNGVFLAVKPKESPFWAYSALGRPVDVKRFAAIYVVPQSPFWMRPAAGNDLAKLPPRTSWLLMRHEDGFRTLVVTLRNGGRFAAWTQAEPARVCIDGVPAESTWANGLLETSVEADAICEILIEF